MLACEDVEALLKGIRRGSFGTKPAVYLLAADKYHRLTRLTF